MAVGIKLKIGSSIFLFFSNLVLNVNPWQLWLQWHFETFLCWEQEVFEKGYFTQTAGIVYRSFMDVWLGRVSLAGRFRYLDTFAKQKSSAATSFL